MHIGKFVAFQILAICLSAWCTPAQSAPAADSAFHVSDAQGKSLILAKPPSGQPVVIGNLWNDSKPSVNTMARKTGS